MIQPLIGGLRREADPILRSAVADALAAFVSACIDRTPSPNDRCPCNAAHCVPDMLLERAGGGRRSSSALTVSVEVMTRGQENSAQLMPARTDGIHAVRRIVKNLCAMACDDPGETPRASAPDPPPSDDAPASTASRENGSEAPCEDPALAARAVARQVGVFGTCRDGAARF